MGSMQFCAYFNADTKRFDEERGRGKMVVLA